MACHSREHVIRMAMKHKRSKPFTSKRKVKRILVEKNYLVDYDVQITPAQWGKIREKELWV